MTTLTSTQLLDKAKELQAEFKKINAYWSLYSCVLSIYEKEEDGVHDGDLREALREAAKIDNGQKD